MNSVQPQNLLAVGVDTAAKAHRAVALKFPEQIMLDLEFANLPQGFQQLDAQVAALAQEHGLTVIYGLEGSGSYGRTLADFLLRRGRDVREVQAVKVNRQKTFYGQDKSDQIDAKATAAVVMRAGKTLPGVPARDANLEALRKTSRFVDQLVEEQTRNLNQLHAALLETYQARAKTLFEDLNSATALEFYQAFPSPQQLKGLSRTKLANFLARAARGTLGRGKGSRAWQRAQQILEQCQELMEAPPPPGQPLHHQIIVCLCQQILHSKKMIQNLNRSLKEELLPHTGMKLESFTGISTRAASIIIGETRGIERFHSKDAFARYNGTAPASKSSGGQVKHRARKDCNHRLKRIFFLIALVNAQHDPRGQAYYQACIQRGLNHAQALKRLARRISDIVYALMRDKSAYDPAVAQKSMEQRRGSKKDKGGAAQTNEGLNNDKSLTPPVDNSTTKEARC